MLLHSLLYSQILTNLSANPMLTYFREFSLAKQKVLAKTKKDKQPVSQKIMIKEQIGFPQFNHCIFIFQFITCYDQKKD